jgi:transcriptional regulator with XRE-family HTH domain
MALMGSEKRGREKPATTILRRAILGRGGYWPQAKGREDDVAQSVAVIDVLKRELKARGITYAEVARAVALSEASIKRLFSRGGFTLERIDQICTAVGIEFTDLTRDFNREQHLLARLTDAQEREIVGDPKLFLVAVCALNLLAYEDILAAYELEPAELVALLLRLDKMGILELLPHNRYKLRIARTFAWIPDGPIQTAFKNHANDFFDSRFAADNELMILQNGRLSRASMVALLEKLRRVAREFSAQHMEDAELPAAERPALSLLLACRPWHPQFMRALLRRPATALPTRRIRHG